MSQPKVAEKKAAELLNRCGITRPPIDLEVLAKQIGADIQYERLESSVSALLVRAADGQARIGVNASHHRNRQRFSIAHEIGHFLLHSHQPTLFVDGEMIYFRDNASSEARDKREIQANAFAASVLMPEDLLRADLHGAGIDIQDDVAVKRLAERYQVSPQSLAIRLVNLGLVSGI